MLALRRLAKNSQNVAPFIFATARHFSSPNPNPIPVPSSASYDDLINAAGRKRDFATVRHLLAKRITDGCYNTSKTFKFIAADFSALDDLLQNLAALSNWFTRKHAHDALVAQLAKLNRTREALSVAETMAKKKYGATHVTFHPIINVLARKKDIPAAWHVVEVMRECELQPDLTAFNYILTAHCFLGDITSAADVLVKMEEEGVGADARTYDALVLCACRAEKVEVAVGLMRRMMEDGVAALYSTHAHIIKEIICRGYIAQAVEFVRIFAGTEVKLDEENFGFLARHLKNMKRVSEAKSVVEEMEKRGLPIGKELMDLSPCKMTRRWLVGKEVQIPGLRTFGGHTSLQGKSWSLKNTLRKMCCAILSFPLVALVV
ncbi:hypothetical protein ACJIZ3_009559 [Penstemon smallii]|uniref:Pentatricopeptide repeat-containing protein-mitochondrial domain-containing protein n=1 Tax=Penstemon smallii TaxID=265156 RepID=A0ABD3TEM4_9LAMI